MNKKIILFSLFCFVVFGLSAQIATDTDHIRRGNRLYVDSLFERAEVEYRKALEINAESVDAMYNLGNALFNQIPQAGDKAEERGKEAMKLYLTASQLETDKSRLARIYHNMGTLMYMAQQYPQSVEAYKMSLRNNPSDDETRYNLAKAMHMLKQQQQDPQEQQEEQQQDQQDQQQQDQQQDQQQESQQNQQEQNQNQEENQQQNQQEQSEQSEEQISKENAEQILNALMQDEKDIQERQKQMMQQRQGKSFDKDW